MQWKRDATELGSLPLTVLKHKVQDPGVQKAGGTLQVPVKGVSTVPWGGASVQLRLAAAGTELGFPGMCAGVAAGG